jgi:hypothetical protein
MPVLLPAKRVVLEEFKSKGMIIKDSKSWEKYPEMSSFKLGLP